jgi:hypothetical protein
MISAHRQDHHPEIPGQSSELANLETGMAALELTSLMELIDFLPPAMLFSHDKHMSQMRYMSVRAPDRQNR